METASIVKVAILATLLHRHEEDGTELSSYQRSLATQMIEDSDNNAATALWDDDGGATGVQEFVDAAGMNDTTAGPGGYWGLTRTTAADQVRLLTLLVTPNGLLDASSRAYILGLMHSVTPEQAWGITAGAASGVTVAVKNGWLDDDNGGWHINSLGVFTGGRHTYVMAVTTDDNPSEDYGIGTIETIAAAVNERIQETDIAAPTPTVTPTPTPTHTPRSRPTATPRPTPARVASHAAVPTGSLAVALVTRPSARHLTLDAAEWLLVLLATAFTWLVADRLLNTRRGLH
jgi:hypothetical protein